MYQRVLLKISGEALKAGSDILCDDTISKTAAQLKAVADMGVQIGVVLGGGNIWRGARNEKMDRSRADHMGMLAITINCLAMQDALLQLGAKCTVLSAVDMPCFCDTYTSRKAQALLQEGHILLFACGSGHPYFTTDTAAALRAAEIGANALLLAKNVDAIYSADPKLDPTATRYDTLTYAQVIEQKLRATDLTAITLCSENNIPIVAFGLQEENTIIRAAKGEKIGTLIAGA